ncbi:MAG TPA: hypothetical protein DC054_01945 [Blastocatellia bacterium]|nr:hypothetical protein [Blastocatellia bacterium]
MRLLSSLFVAAIFMLGTMSIAYGQEATPPPGGYDHLPGLDDSSNSRSNPSAPAREPRVVDKGPLALPDQDRSDYADFLAQPNTGLIRLLPRNSPGSAFNYTGERPLIHGDGAYYSFHYRAHEYGYGSDLELSMTQEFNGTSKGLIELPPHRNFSVGFAGADFGMLANLGDVSLTDLTAADPRVAYLLSYETPRAESEARPEYQRFGRGVTADGQTYKQTLPLQSQATYLLRSINYDVSDVLVGFHVVREESDGSVIVAWKLLKSYPTPQLARDK